MPNLLIRFPTMIIGLALCYVNSQSIDEHDFLVEQYFESHQFQIHKHRHTRECQHISYGNVTHSKQKAHIIKGSETIEPIVETRHAIKPIGPSFNQRNTHFHISKIRDPAKTLSVLEPFGAGGCNEQQRAIVKQSSLQKQCLVAINAGFFNTKNGSCLGNVITDGAIVMDSEGVQNAHFGVTKDGHLYFGYLSEIDLVSNQFLQLVGGVIWILRDGKNYIQESIKIECQDTQETGTLETFANVMSSRTVVGSDKDGHVLLFQVDGKTWSNGMTLYELADVLLEYGFVNAINLDGGGSSTYVVNNTLVNYPTDRCLDNSNFNCARNVSTILCVHEPECSPLDCSGHGTCNSGMCHCDKHWTGKGCDQLKCPGDCSKHGICTEDGCNCEKGWTGEDCSSVCPQGYYGKGCLQQCTCTSKSLGTCDPVTGQCHCQAGFTGDLCENDCAVGFYGNNCLSICLCSDGCPCHPLTGSCNFTQLEPHYVEVGTCYAKEQIKKQQLVPDRSKEFRSVSISLICISVIAVLSIIVNIVLVYKLFTTKKKVKKRKTRKKNKHVFQDVPSNAEMSSFSEYPMQTTSFSKAAKDDTGQDSV